MFFARDVYLFSYQSKLLIGLKKDSSYRNVFHGTTILYTKLYFAYCIAFEFQERILRFRKFLTQKIDH